MAIAEVKDNRESRNPEAGEFKDQVIYVGRVTKVVKGGKNFSFSALVVVGDGAYEPPRDAGGEHALRRPVRPGRGELLSASR